ncbi:hypothetical protein E2C01_086371 [Portunus trituberculatus]|uniref:Uncharacterized protein n=1 Tax=Portunus trituberculatus TaxID=210409 RepID=A0A5B7JA49_PORTR|nr:hypothetical protein [Portunus trituberculatus]
MSSGDLIHKVASQLAHSGHLREERKDPTSHVPHRHWDCRSLPSPPVAPFHCLFSEGSGQLTFSNRSHIRIIAAKALADTQNIRIRGISSPNPL